jgi:hypothetical protein
MSKLKGYGKGIMALMGLSNPDPSPTPPYTKKGVYKLNPTKMVMKSGSAKARKAVTEDVPGFRKGPKLKQPKLAKGKTK